MKNAVCAVPLLLLSCTTPAASPEEMLDEIVVCPEGDTPCDRVANGASRVTVQVCIPEDVELRQPKLPVELRLSAGRWDTGGAPENPLSYKTSLGADRCVTPSFVTTTAPAPVRVDAVLTVELGEDESTVTASTYVPLSAAPVSPPEVTTVPKLLGTAATQEVALTVRARALVGKVTDGTRVRFLPKSAAPGTTVVSFVPAEVRVDGTTDTVTATMLVVGAASSVTFDVQAEPPPDAQGTPGEIASTEVTLLAPPPPEE